jgi:hypothetical protein
MTTERILRANPASTTPIDSSEDTHTYIHTIHTVSSSSSSAILRSYKLHESTAESFKQFCDFQHITASHGVECAMLEYMQNHQAELPVNVMFNVTIEAKPSKATVFCGFRGCKNEAVGRGSWHHKKPLDLCSEHLAEARANPKEWEILP